MHKKIEEILSFWYPSHLPSLELIETPDRHESLELRKN